MSASQTIPSHYTSMGIFGSVCHVCHKRVPIRGGFSCPECSVGITQSIITVVDYTSAHNFRLWRHLKHTTLFVERHYIVDALPEGILHVLSANYAVTPKGFLLCYPGGITVDERLVEMAMEKLAADGITDARRDRVRSLIFNLDLRA